MESTRQNRYLPTDGVSFMVECIKPGDPAAVAGRRFTTYDRADVWLDHHEDACPHGHTISRCSTISASGHSVAALRHLPPTQCPAGLRNVLALDPRP